MGRQKSVPLGLAFFLLLTLACGLLQRPQAEPNPPAPSTSEPIDTSTPIVVLPSKPNNDVMAYLGMKNLSQWRLYLTDPANPKSSVCLSCDLPGILAVPFFQIAWSPDHAKIAFLNLPESSLSAPQTGSSIPADLYIATYQGERKLVHSWRIPGSPKSPLSWSPDGERLAIAFNSVADGQQSLHILDTSSGDEYETMLPGLLTGWWDSNSVTYVADKSFYLMDVHSFKTTQLIPNSKFSFSYDQLSDVDAPLWSPDHNYLVASGASADSPYCGGVCVLRKDGTVLMSLDVDSSPPSLEVWSPDSKKVALATNYDAKRKVPLFNIFVADIRTKTITQLTASTDTDLATFPAWSPYGDKIAYTRDGIWVMNPDGTDNKRLIPESASAMDPIW